MRLAIRIVTVIQARVSSSRLPGKVLLPLAGKTVLERMVERVRAARLSGNVVVATTVNSEDDLIADICTKENIDFHRGDKFDLLDRHLKAGLRFGAEVIIKIPSDCPLIDPAVIDRVISFYLDNKDKYDYVSNLHPATYPDGNDVEIIPVPILEIAWKEAARDFEREHTTPFIWENPERFRLGNVSWERGLDYSMEHRWTLDYREDYEFVSAVYNELYNLNPQFHLDDVLNLLEIYPRIKSINQKYAGVNWYRHHIRELRTISPEMTRNLNTENNTKDQYGIR
ncbi:MAG: cytidylyltransferase domain-containing protein [Ignavibacteriales bacterium]